MPLKDSKRIGTSVVLASGVIACALAFGGACVDYLDADAGAPDDASTSDASKLDGGTPESSTSGDGGTEASACTTYECAVLADKPLLYLRLGESGGLTAIDSSGRGYDGDYPATELTFRVPGAVANDTAVDFLGGGSEILMRPGLDFDGTDAKFTVEFWIKPTDASEFRFIVDHENHDGERQGWFVGLDTGGELAVEMWINTATSFAVARAPGALKVGEWNHVVVAYDQAAFRLYGWVNKQPKITQQLGDNVTPLPSLAKIGSWRIGRQNCAPGCLGPSYLGTLDELAIYDRVFDQSRVNDHYAKSGR